MSTTDYNHFSTELPELTPSILSNSILKPSLYQDQSSLTSDYTIQDDITIDTLNYLFSSKELSSSLSSSITDNNQYSSTIVTTNL